MCFQYKSPLRFFVVSMVRTYTIAYCRWKPYTTLRQYAPFTPMYAKEKHKFTSEVAEGDHNNCARHLYNIARNPKYNLWTDPSTGNGYNANNYGWHNSLMDAVR